MTFRKLVAAGVMLMVLVGLGVVALGPKRIFGGGKKKLERGWLILTGGLVNVGGHRLRVERFGKGSPTVVFEAGLAQPRTTWGRVPNDVAAFAQVVIYDRANLGDSDEIQGQRTSKQIVAELHAMLKAAGVEAPYVLVGHSFGGLNVRLFASQFPDEVAGIVLVDASHEDQANRFAELLSEPERQNYLQHEGGGNYEHVDLLASSEEVRAAAPIKPLPLVVVSAPGNKNSGDASAKVHDELQLVLSRLLPNASQVIAENSGHFVQLDRPELVTNAIRTVIEQTQRK
ncbi:MAG: alpha/beta hydrolase [Acidobacteriota bacterium]|nr:alpha/beta hydrolase [Acidobacteriota bacterium]